MQTAWKLMRGEETVGVLTPTETDQSFSHFVFSPTPAFDVIRHLYAEELRLFNADPFTGEDWEAAYARIDALGLTLVAVDGTESIDDFLLHVDGDRAWFRY